MLTLPIPTHLKAIARSYQGACLKHEGHFNEALRILEQAVEESPLEFKGRALHILGATRHDRGEVDAAIPLFLAAGEAANGYDPFALLQSHWMIAIGRGIHGDHNRALADLENLFPLVRKISGRYPASYYDFLNSLAVELGEVGRLSEAHAALNMALASPLAPAYPNWCETRAELEGKRTAASRSVVAIGLPSHPSPSMRAENRRNKLLTRRAAINRRFASRAAAAIPRAATRPIAIQTHSETAAVAAALRPQVGPGPRAPPMIIVGVILN